MTKWTLPDRDRPRLHVYRGSLPFWLGLLMLAPLALLFFVSLLIAGAVLAIGGLLGMLVLPLFSKHRNRGRADRTSIELDPSEYRHIESPDERR